MEIDADTNRPVPVLLGKHTTEFFKQSIESRHAFARLVSDVFAIYINKCLSTFFKRLVQQSITSAAASTSGRLMDTAVWLGGSRAWYYSLDCYFPSTYATLDLTTQASVYPGNYDVFVMHANPKTYRALYTSIKHYVETIMIPALYQLTIPSEDNNDVKVVDVYTIELIEAKGKLSGRDKKEPVKESELPMCALMHCKNLAVNLVSRRTGARKASAIIMPDGWVFNEPKLLFYVEVGLLENVQLDLVAYNFFASNACHNRVDYNILNFHGLFLMANLINTARKEKGLDVDTYRRELVTQLTRQVPNFSPYTMYLQTAELYKQTFRGTSFYDESVLNDFHFQAFMLEYERTFHENLMDQYEKAVVEQVRPLLNSCLFMLNAWIRNTEPFKNDLTSFLMIVGGDAMRRYRNNITVTKDIDSKFYINPRMWNSEPKKKALRTQVLSWMSCFTLLMETLFVLAQPKVQKLPLNNQLYSLAMQALESRQPIPGAAGQNAGAFRLRFIQETDDFPVDLWSIDFRATMWLQTPTGKVMQTKVTIPVLDVVMQPNKKGLTRDTAIAGNTQMTLPIASLPFLLDDLTLTYTNVAMATMRYWGKKNSKDEQRYMTLRHLLQQNTQYDGQLDVYTPIALLQAALMEIQDQGIQEYRDNFAFQMEKLKKEKKYKFKIPFTQTKRTEISKQRREGRLHTKHDVMDELKLLQQLLQ